MVTTLRDDIKQKKPFKSLQEEAGLNVIRTAAVMTDALDQLLKPYGISSTQYNVLRILRGAEPGGLCRNEVRDRMLTRMPDMTRLLDRMEDAGLVKRSREGEDRRMVITRITKQGLKLVDEVDGPMSKLNKSMFGPLSDPQLRSLSDLLTLARQGG